MKMESSSKSKKLLRAILTLDCGYRFKVELAPLNGVDLRHPEQLERDIVKRWNQSQPNMVHKVTKCHLLRN